MVKYAIVRDDDPSYFTSYKQLEAVYGEIFSLDVPVSSCVIPCVETGVNLPNVKFYGGYLDCEPFIPEELRSVHQKFPVDENHELIEFFENNRNYLDLLQHGFSHSLHESASTNFGDVERKVLEGRKILEKSFHRTPMFFSAPYDLYSPISLLVLRRHFFGATCGEIKFKTMLSPKTGIRLPLDMVPSYLNALHCGCVFYFCGDFLMLGYSNITRLSPFEDSVLVEQTFKEYVDAHEVIVIALHYWQFFCDRQKKIVGDSVDKSALDSVIEKVQWLKSRGTQFLTVSEFYKKFC